MGETDGDLLAARLAKSCEHSRLREPLPQRSKVKRSQGTHGAPLPIYTHRHVHMLYTPHSYIAHTHTEERERIRKQFLKKIVGKALLFPFYR